MSDSEIAQDFKRLNVDRLLFDKEFLEAKKEKRRERAETTSSMDETNDEIVDLENIWEGVNLEVKLIRE